MESEIIFRVRYRITAQHILLRELFDPQQAATRTHQLPTPTNKMSKSHLLALPAELRNKIYEHALIDPQCVRRHFTHLADPMAKSCPGPALLQTCRQIRAEATELYYSNNTFIIKAWHAPQMECEPVLEAWLRAIGPETRKFIKVVRVEHWVQKLPHIMTEGQWEDCLRMLRVRLIPIAELIEGIELQMLNRSPAAKVREFEEDEEAGVQRWITL